MNLLRVIACCLVLPFAVPFARAADSQFVPLDSPMENPSPYTPVVTALAKRPPKAECQLSDSSLHVHAYLAQSSPFYIGVRKSLLVHASVAKMEAFFDDLDQLKNLYPEFKQTSVTERSGNKMTAFWERTIPVFFVPNVKYETNYLVDKRNPQRGVYRYKLGWSKSIKNIDGIINMVAMGPNDTCFMIWDFFEAEWGPVKVMGQESIWKSSIKGSFVADMGMKVRIENPDLSYPKVIEMANKLAEKYSPDQIYEQRRSAATPEAMAAALIKEINSN
ncbi:MAG: hypothetical protein ACXWP5_14415 [Bdellovibrionota bacterium]